jgi:hypothetical protein
VRGIAYKEEAVEAAVHLVPFVIASRDDPTTVGRSRLLPVLSYTAAERADVWVHMLDTGHHHLHQHHFFMPHPQFLHGFSLLSGKGNPEAVAGHGNG